MRKLGFRFIISSILFFPVFLLGQLQLYDFTERRVLQLEKPNNTVVFIYTDWCRYCENMKQTTFKQKEIINVLNQNFYTIFLNAEEKKNIFFSGKSYRFLPSGFQTGVHELVLSLGTADNPLFYPAIVIINGDDQVIFRQSGFLTAVEFRAILSHFAK